jgi:hypothetical protein
MSMMPIPKHANRTNKKNKRNENNSKNRRSQMKLRKKSFLMVNK